ncbi:Uncharacterised protein [Serratia entomophila]|nr:Uncharacterised protein [Serratia entomophila]CAI1790857.1 Uncharacterised protein [Serratia entomophila]CAI1829740.1 Uncharacterised protein [Serratia entomophila]CAI1844672.1 Uncharacterised protein [Serratia entomophila]CAI1914500.1 Uncharacterised protein [Serratia entomophila]
MNFMLRFVVFIFSLTPLISSAVIPESRMIEFEERVSLPVDTEIKLRKLGMDIYNASFKKLYSFEGWGKYGHFSDVNMALQGSIAYGMALADSSDLDIAFVYKYNHGNSMYCLDPVKLKEDAIDIFKSTFGDEYIYTIKSPVVNLRNNVNDIDIAFFNMLNESTGECLVDNKCSELNYGKDEITAEWYESERLSLYSVMDKVFGIGTEKRDLINRTGKMFKVWRSKIFPNDEERVPSIALVTMLYDFSKEKGEEYDYVKSTDTHP